MLDLSQHAFIYAQALDNEGNPEYWLVRDDGSAFDRLTLSDARLPAIRRYIDELMATGRVWSSGSEGLECRVSWSGVCVISIKPLTRDADGRLSPVLLLFNVLGRKRVQGTIALASIQSVMGRELVSADVKHIAELKKFLQWPRLLILLHIVFFSRRKKID